METIEVEFFRSDGVPLKFPFKWEQIDYIDKKESVYILSAKDNRKWYIIQESYYKVARFLTKVNTEKRILR
jgi:hypothetical protein